MAIREFDLKNPTMSHKKDYFVIGDSLTDMLNICRKHSRHMNFSAGEWTGRMAGYEALECLSKGHLPSVAPSDKFLAEVENILPVPTARHEIIDDVSGGVPNVQAFLAGVPLNMRRKVKRENEAAPIAIVVDTVLSGGISDSDLVKRGSAVLALVRALSTRRPVELYVGGTLHAKGSNAQWLYFRMDTAPLDLARAAFALSHAGFVRGLIYNLGRGCHEFGGGWAYNDYEAYKRTAAKTIKQAFPHMEDMIFVPGAFVKDPTIENPIAWIKANVAAHLGAEAGA